MAKAIAKLKKMKVMIISAVGAVVDSAAQSVQPRTLAVAD